MDLPIVKSHKLAGVLVLAAHWVVAIGHLVLVAKVLPAPDNRISSVAISLLSFVHLSVALVWWKGPDKLAGWALSILFLLALSSGIYEHFLHSGTNNVFMVRASEWRTVFQVSVVFLVTLEVSGVLIGLLSLKGQGQDRRAGRGPGLYPSGR